MKTLVGNSLAFTCADTNGYIIGTDSHSENIVCNGGATAAFATGWTGCENKCSVPTPLAGSGYNG